MPCSGNGATLCGGANRVSRDRVVSYRLSGLYPLQLNMYNYTAALTGPTNPPADPPPDPNPGNGPQPLTTGLPGTWHYAHCWVDNQFGRILSNQGLAPSPTMTVQKCINYCDSQGFVLAGLQFSQGS